MANVQCLADGHHVDDAGNLICCTYVDFRELAERAPITALQKASSKRHAIPGCETIRISKPACFLDQGEGLASDDEAHHGTNGWICCASIEPETAEEQAAWRKAMPASRGAVSPIRRPRAFARALGAMVAEQAGPCGRIVLLRNTVESRTFCTAHKSQTIYHGPVVYADDPAQRLESATSDLELLLLLVFLKHAAHRPQRKYRFVVWAEREPEEDRVDLEVSPALADAMWRPRQQPEGSGLVPPGMNESSSVEELRDPGQPASVRVEALPAFLGARNPAVAPRSYDRETLPDELRETATVRGAVETLREAVDRSDVAGRQDAAAAAWHAEPVVRFLCATLDGAIAGVRVTEDGFIAITAQLAGDGPVETRIAVGPDGTCACTIRSGETLLASESSPTAYRFRLTAPDPWAFERVLKSRLAEVGVHGEDDTGGG